MFTDHHTTVLRQALSRLFNTPTPVEDDFAALLKKIDSKTRK